MSKHDKLATKVEFFHRLALYGKRADFLAYLTKEAQAQVSAPVVSREGSPGAPVDLDAPVDVDTYQDPSGASFQQVPEMTVSAYPPVPKDVQNFLNQLGYNNPKDGKPLKIDGLLGPETQMALNWFKSVYQVPAGTSNQDLFETVRYHGQRQSPITREMT